MAVVGIDISWGKFSQGRRCGLCVHREGLVHADKRQVDVFKATHFGRIFGVAGNLVAQVMRGQHKTAVAPFW